MHLYFFFIRALGMLFINKQFCLIWLGYSWVYLLDPTESLHSLYELCPYTVFCQGGPLISDHGFAETGKMPCCLPCSCHDECERIGNCCPDKETTSQIRIGRQYPCKPLKTYRNNYLNVHNKKDRDLFFRIIDSCPDEFIHGNESDSRCYGEATIGDLYFVTDVKSNITYVNERCALCNGVTDIVKWDLNIQWSYYFNYEFTSIIDVEKVILNSSKIMYAIPPSQEVGLLSICKPKPIDVCMDTLTMSAVNTIVQDNCRNNKALLVIDRQYHIETYSNPYCMLCNVLPTFQLDTQCASIDFGMKKSRSGIVPFSAIILADSHLSHKTMILRHSRCASTQVFDPISKTCMDLKCPPATYPEQGQCKKVFDEINGFGVDLHYTVAGDIMSVGNRELAYELFDFIQEKLLKARLNCVICRVAMTEDERSAAITISTNRFCDHMLLLKFIGSKSFHKQLDFNDPYGIQFNVTMTAGGEWHNAVIRNYLCKTALKFDKHTIYCPSIGLDLLSLEKYGLGDNKEWLATILKSSNLIDGEKLVICLEDYQHIYRDLYNSTDLLNSCKKVKCLILLVALLSILFTNAL